MRITLLLLSALVLGGWGALSMGGGVPDAGGGGSPAHCWTDTFTTQPGNWIAQPGQAEEVSFSGGTAFYNAGNQFLSGGLNETDSVSGPEGQYVTYQWPSQTGDGNNGVILRSDGAWQSGSAAYWLYINVVDETFGVQRILYGDDLTDSTQTNASVTGQPATGDWVTFQVVGTGSGTTTMKYWDHGSSDPGACDADGTDCGFGSPTSSITYSGTAVDTGNYIGLASWPENSGTPAAAWDNLSTGSTACNS